MLHEFIASFRAGNTSTWKQGRASTGAAWVEDAIGAWKLFHTARADVHATQVTAITEAVETFENSVSDALDKARGDASDAAGVYQQERAEILATRAIDHIETENEYDETIAAANYVNTVLEGGALADWLAAQSKAYQDFVTTDGTAGEILANTSAAKEKALINSLADAAKTYAHTLADLDRDRVMTGWNAWKDFTSSESKATEVRTVGNAQDASGVKKAFSALDTTMMLALANASTHSRITTIGAMEDRALTQGRVDLAAGVERARALLVQLQSLSATDNKFASLMPDMPETETQKFGDAVKRLFRAPSEGIEMMLNWLTDGWSRDALTSETFTRVLDSVDQLFAGIAHAATAGLSSLLREKLYGELATRNHQGLWFNIGMGIGAIITLVGAFANPCNMSTAMRWAWRGWQGTQSVGMGIEAVHAFQEGNNVMGVINALGSVFTFMSLFRACFAAGTPIECEGGSKAIESFTAGEKVWSRNEFDPKGEDGLKAIEEAFVRIGRIWELRVNGVTIRTTGEHPFFSEEGKWNPCREMRAGERTLLRDGNWGVIEEIVDTNVDEVVFNFRVADYHTYFVGYDDWGFSVWAHNTYNNPVKNWTDEEI